jgi:hypothetical protein
MGVGARFLPILSMLAFIDFTVSSQCSSFTDAFSISPFNLTLPHASTSIPFLNYTSNNPTVRINQQQQLANNGFVSSPIAILQAADTLNLTIANLTACPFVTGFGMSLIFNTVSIVPVGGEVALVNFTSDVFARIQFNITVDTITPSFAGTTFVLSPAVIVSRILKIIVTFNPNGNSVAIDNVNITCCPDGSTIPLTSSSTSPPTTPTGTPGSSSTQGPASQTSATNNTTVIAVSVSVSVSVVFLCIALCVILYCMAYERDRRAVSVHPSLVDSQLYNPKIIIDPSSIKVGDTIGSGNFGTVCIGNYNSQEVALKKTNRGDNAGLLREVNTLKELNHPSIVRFFGIWSSPQEPLEIYLVMEYMNGGDLLALLLRRGNEIPLLTKKKFCLTIALGVLYLHNNGIIHRDLAARNILVRNPDSKEPELKISDFGLSREAESLYVVTDKTTPVKWSPPEMLWDKEKVSSPEQDVWMFGVLMFEIFSNGETPYKTMSNSEAAAYICKGEVLNYYTAVPESLHHLVKKCFSYERNDRPKFNVVVAELESTQEIVHREELPFSTSSSGSSIEKPRPLILLEASSKRYPTGFYVSTTSEHTNSGDSEPKDKLVRSK